MLPACSESSPSMRSYHAVQRRKRSLEVFSSGISSDIWARTHQQHVRDPQAHTTAFPYAPRLLITALLHLIAGLTLLGYAQNYYFHLRKCSLTLGCEGCTTDWLQVTTRTMLIKLV